MTSSSIAVIALVFLIGLVLGGAVIWLIARSGSRTVRTVAPIPEKNTPELTFRFSYIALSSAVALVSIIGLAVMYSSLPAEVYYQFSSNGVLRGSISRELFIVLMIGGQLVLVAVAAVIALTILGIARRMLKGNAPLIDPGRIIWLMANMVVLPQLIVAFVGLDAAYYATSGSHIVTPWVFSLATIGFGTLIIITLFVRSINDARRVK
jgi:hypothetical protein